MDALGHQRFAVVGHDTGYFISYALAADPPDRVDRDALPGSFGFYRAFDTTVGQNEQCKSRRLTMPVLAIGGEASCGEHVAEATELVADGTRAVTSA